MRNDLPDLLTPATPLVVVDAGAAGGIHPRWKGLTPHQIVVAFDPDPRMEVSGDNLTEVLVVPAALGEESRDETLHLCRKAECSSLLEPNQELLEGYPDPGRYEVVDSVEVPCMSLDAALPRRDLSTAHFIKIDAQGYALPILRGAESLLTGAVGVEVEVEFVELYRGQHLFHEVDAHLQSRGFHLYDLRRYFWRRTTRRLWPRHKGQMVFAEALYLRTPEALVVSDQLTPHLAHAFLVYVAYGLLDCADVLHHLCVEKQLLAGDILHEMEAFLEGRSSSFTGVGIPGLGRIRRGLESFFDLLQKDNHFYFGTDQRLGNRRL